MVRLARRLDRVESVLAIGDLKARYAALVDERFSRGRPVGAEAMGRVAGRIAELFTEDAVWDGGPALGMAVGRGAIRDRLAAPTLTFSRHLFVQPEISVDGDHARGRWQLLCPCTTADGTDALMAGIEDDEYLRSGGVWRHRRMALTTVFMAPAHDGWGRILH